MDSGGFKHAKSQTMKTQKKKSKTKQTDSPAISISGMLADGGSNQAVNSNSSTDEKIHKSEALLDFIRRRMDESKAEMELETTIPLKNKLRGKYFAFKEVADFIRNSGTQRQLDEIARELHFAEEQTRRILSIFPAVEKARNGNF